MTDYKFLSVPDLIREGFTRVPGYRTHYINREGKIFKESADGYCRPVYVSDDLRIQFMKDGKKETISLAYLVARNFIPNLEAKKCIIFKDGDKTNVKAENLKWATHSEKKSDEMLRHHKKLRDKRDQEEKELERL